MEVPKYNNYFEEQNNKETHLPISQESELNFQSLLKVNQIYVKCNFKISKKYEKTV